MQPSEDINIVSAHRLAGRQSFSALRIIFPRLAFSKRQRVFSKMTPFIRWTLVVSGLVRQVLERTLMTVTFILFLLPLACMASG